MVPINFDLLSMLSHLTIEQIIECLRETIAKQYHEICREMVNRQIGMITKPTQPYIEWKDLTDDQRKRRMFIAERIIQKILNIPIPDSFSEVKQEAE